MTITRAPYSPPGMLVKKLLIISSPWNPLKTRENIDAPIKIIKTNELIFTVVIAASEIFLRFKSLLNKAKIAAPAAPTEADSVGVATPRKIDPRTAKIKNIGGITSNRAFFHISAFGLLVILRGNLSGCNLAV